MSAIEGIIKMLEKQVKLQKPCDADAVVDELEEAQAELAELHKDRERLDILRPTEHEPGQSDPYGLLFAYKGQFYKIKHTHYRGKTGWYLFFVMSLKFEYKGRFWGPFDTFGAAIDAAMNPEADK